MLGRMALDLSRTDALAELRFAPTAKRVRAWRGETLVLDSTDAVLVWEPRRVVPLYAVPPDDLRVPLTPGEPAELPEPLRPVLSPGRFEWHTCPGTPLHATVDGTDLGEVAFRPDDPDLGGRVVVDWRPFEWVEEDEPVVAHPHDPFKRIDILRSARHVRVELDGTVLAESRRPVALFETSLPTRWYLPRGDVRTDLLTPSDTHTTCAYKGVASYLSAPGEKGRDIAWYYPDPLHEALPVKDLVAFWSERAEIWVDGVRDRGFMPPEL